MTAWWGFFLNLFLSIVPGFFFFLMLHVWVFGCMFVGSCYRSSKLLLAARWVLEIEPQSTRRTTSAFCFFFLIENFLTVCFVYFLYSILYFSFLISFRSFPLFKLTYFLGFLKQTKPNKKHKSLPQKHKSK